MRCQETVVTGKNKGKQCCKPAVIRGMCMHHYLAMVKRDEGLNRHEESKLKTRRVKVYRPKGWKK